MRRFRPVRFCWLLASIQLAGLTAWSASPEEAGARLILVKIDGMPGLLLEAMLDPGSAAARRLPDPAMFQLAYRRACQATGREILLPNLTHYFSRQGIRCEMRSSTLTLSGPSWAVIDTGQPGIVKTNSYFNRYSGLLRNYLDQFREVYGLALGQTKRTTALWQLDLLGIPVMADAFPPRRTWQSIQLYCRERPVEQIAEIAKVLAGAGEKTGNPLKILRNHLKAKVYSPDYQELSDQVMVNILAEKIRRTDPDGKPAYEFLSVLLTALDHQLHVDPDYHILMHWFTKIDGWLGKIMDAVLAGPASDRSLVVIVSDHGLDFDPGRTCYSLPVNGWLREPVLGGHTIFEPVVEDLHHAITVPVPGLDYNRVMESLHSPYGKSVPYGEDGYWTAFADNSGNLRFDAFFRNSGLNELHLLLLEGKRLAGHPPGLRQVYSVFREVAGRNQTWIEEAIRQGEQCVHAYRRSIQSLTEKPDPENADAVKRFRREIEEMERVSRALRRLLETGAGYHQFEEWCRSSLPVSTLIPKGYLGPVNTVAQLVRYTTGWEEGPEFRWREGGVPAFRRLNYPRQLTGFQASNASAYGNPHPFAMVAARDRNPVPVTAPNRPWRQVVRLWFAPDGRCGELLEDEEGQLCYRPAGNGGDPAPFAAVSSGSVPRPDQHTVAAEPPLANRWLEWRQWVLLADEYPEAMVPVILADLYRENFQPVLDHNRRWLPGAGENPELDLTGSIRFHFEQQESDLRVWTSRGWNVNSNSHTPGGGHGGFSKLETQVVFALWGGAWFPLRRGGYLAGASTTLDVAPTLFSLLGMLDDQGRVQPREGTGWGETALPLPGRVLGVASAAGVRR